MSDLLDILGTMFWIIVIFWAIAELARWLV